MSELVFFDLNEQVNRRAEKTKELSRNIELLEQKISEEKKKHATAMMELWKVNIYKQRAKACNENIFFEWQQSENDLWDRTGKQFHNSIWLYETPTMKFKINLKKRHDLKIWKYEVHVSGTRVYFENFDLVKMYERERKTGWYMGWANFLKDYFSEKELMKKFKTFEEAALSIETWKKTLKTKFNFEINYDKSLYQQACSRYESSIHIQLNYECAKEFYNQIKLHDLELEKGDYWNVEITGHNAKEIVMDIKKQFDMTFSILAG